MPEYPEVTIVQRSLNDHVKGKTILKTEVKIEKIIKNTDPNSFINFCKNKLINDIENFGKYLVFNFSDNSRLISHLRMAGKYYIRDINDPYLYNYKHDCIYFFLDNQKVMVYNDTRMFGSFEIIESNNIDSIYQIKKLAKLPGDVDANDLYQKIKNRNISIKKILLDQSLVLGIGNIYADEALFESQIYPMTKAKDISYPKLCEILKNAQDIMDKSILYGGSSVKDYSSVNGINGKFQNELKVYGRAGLECLRCKAHLIKKVKLDFKENGRGTSYCENCQK